MRHERLTTKIENMIKEKEAFWAKVISKEPKRSDEWFLNQVKKLHKIETGMKNLCVKANIKYDQLTFQDNKTIWKFLGRQCKKKSCNHSYGSISKGDKPKESNR